MRVCAVLVHVTWCWVLIYSMIQLNSRSKTSFYNITKLGQMFFRHGHWYLLQLLAPGRQFASHKATSPCSMHWGHRWPGSHLQIVQWTKWHPYHPTIVEDGIRFAWPSELPCMQSRGCTLFSATRLTSIILQCTDPYVLWLIDVFQTRSCRKPVWVGRIACMQYLWEVDPSHSAIPLQLVQHMYIN